MENRSLLYKRQGGRIVGKISAKRSVTICKFRNDYRNKRIFEIFLSHLPVLPKYKHRRKLV